MSAARIGVLLAYVATVGACAACLLAGEAAAAPSMTSFVVVSPRDARYFELSDGTPYIPIGLNVIHPRGGSAEEGLAQMEAWMRALAENGGNYLRVWLSSPFWDVEHARAGVYDAEKARRIDALLAAARRHGIRVKCTIEHFREIDPGDVRQAWASKQLHHVSRGGTAARMPEWLALETSRVQFKRKLAWYRERYGDEPAVFGWELWNEINAVRGGDYMAWTEAMLPELARLFPRNLAMQSLGSFDRDGCRADYRRLCALEGNDVAQVHRYLDLGAALEVCHGPVDVLAADAVRELLAAGAGKPVMLAESGAVEPRHSGPFKLYRKDRAGMILHDVLFAPFFAGAAGAGQCWHWSEYVDENGLWHRFRGFAGAVRGIDPPAEKFEPLLLDRPPLRVYILKGARTTLAWCRDAENTWRSELAEGRAPEERRGMVLPLKDVVPPGTPSAQTYDPWTDTRAAASIVDGAVRLPPFTRSIVVTVPGRK